MDDYTHTFDIRGSAYDRAMRAFPHARAEEFAQLLEPLRLRPGRVLGDVPAGGGYLRDYLPEHCVYQGHEPSGGFTGHGRDADAARSTDLLPLPWPEDTLDAVVSLAGVHHIANRTGLFRALAAATRPAGCFVLSDVGKDSPPARFLDGFVGSWNGTGHDGHYLDNRTISELNDGGWSVITHATRKFHWLFADIDAMTSFAGQLFNIASAGDAAIAGAIEAELGVDVFADGHVGMRWSLERFVCVNRKPGHGC